MKRKRLTPTQAMEKWNALPPDKQNSWTSKDIAKMAGMRSIGEVRFAADLEARGITYKYEPYILMYNYEPKKHRYTPDFSITNINNKEILVVEYKGKMTKQTRDKLIAIKKCHPAKRICIVFEKPNNKIGSWKGATRYWEWAEQHGFEWSEQYALEEWLNDDIV